MNNYFELSHPQKRIWFTEERYEGTAFANNAVTVRYSENIDVRAMTQALNLVVKKNDGLRIRLARTEEDIKIRQYVSPFREFEPGLIDLSEKDETAAAGWFENKTRQPFELIDSDLFWFSLVKFSAGEYGYYMKIHHIISDGWTILGLLIDEIEEHYELIRNNKTPDETPYPSYVKFISQENEYLQSPQALVDREFWHKTLSPLPEEVNLSEKKPKTDSIAAKAEYLRVPAELNAEIYRYCKEYKSSVFKLFLPALAIYISRITSSNEAVIGSANHNRSSEEQKKTTGMFVSTMPLKITVDNGASFNDLVLRSAQEVNFIIKNHSKYPFDQLAGELRKKHGVSPDHLLNVSLVGLPPLGDMRKKVDLIHPGYEPSDLAVHIFEKQENNDKFIELRWSYQTEKFTAENIEKIHNILCQILRDALSAPDKKISKISMCSAEEEKTIRQIFNNTKCEIPRNVTVHQLFEKQAELYPENFAVVADERKITYKQLDHKANQLAARLRKDGLGPDKPAGILMNNSLETIVGIISVLKAGGCYVPIDPEYPEERISYMLSDSGAKILLTKKSFFDKFNFSGTVYDLEDENIYSGNAGDPEIINTPNDLAYIIYTSGTTGKPKGVMIEHHSLINTCVNYFNTHGVKAGDNTSKYMAPAFDASVVEIFPTLLSGAALHIIPSSIRLSPEHLNDYFEKNHITSAILPTQFGEQFMILTKNRSLRWIEMGGEKLRSFTPQRYVVINGYGPTEYTVETCFFKVDKFYENIPIGKPVCNTNIYIMDGFNNLLPIGVAGELCIAGEGISRGYLNQKELTDKKFIENPFEPGKKIYKTGDLARWLPDGNLEFLGRIDRQVKIRGFRIELAEIEQAMKAVEFIKDAVVVDHVDENNRPYLCGYYLSDNEIDIDKLKKELAKILPDYMVPPYILKIAEIPLTPHGKVDKKALPRPDKSMMTSEFIAASTDDEKILAGIWKEVLKCGEVGVNDNFFTLGGDSIMSIQVSSRSKKAGLDISVGDLQARPTISELLKTLKERLVDAHGGANVAGAMDGMEATDAHGGANVAGATDGKAALRVITDPRPEIEAAYGLSPLQEGFLFYAVSAPDSDQYCTQTCWTYSAKINTDALKLAWEQIFEAHAIFRTGFEWENEDGPYQAVYKKAPVPWNLVDLSGEAPGEREKIVEKHRLNARGKRIDLNKPPIGDIHLFMFGDSEYRFVWTIHHILVDGWSIPLIINELHKRYECIINNEKFSAPPPPPFETYIKWLAAMNNNEPMDYWKNNLQDFSAPTPLAINKKDRKLGVHNAIENPGECVRRFSGAFFDKCKAFARTQQVTLNALFQMAWSAVLSAYSGSDDVLYGVTVAGRPSELTGVESMVGLFINTVPLRARFDYLKSAGENLKNLHKNIQDSSRHCHIPLSKLQALAPLPKGEALFHSIFVFENFPFDENARENEVIGMRDFVSFGKSSYPLNAVVFPGDGATLNLSYDADAFEKESIENMATHIERALGWIVDNPNGLLKDIDMLPEKEKKKLLVEFNRTDVEFPHNVTIQELIQARAEQFPDKTAVVYKNNRLSYRELNERANRLAHTLRSSGVKPDDRVGILVDRSCDMITGPLAILKAGAAFVPIEPQYPADRINYILADSSCRILLTHPHLAEKIKPAVRTIDMTDPANFSGDGKNPPIINNDRDLAYLIYTSGSTGRPKGSMIEHHSLVNLCLCYQKNNSITELDNFAKYVSFGFDASIIEIFPALVSGSALYVIPDELRLSPEGLNEYFEANNITMAVFPTPFGEQFMTLTDNRSLRWMELGGDKLKVFKKQKYKVVNGYGPTECTVCATNFAVENWSENIPIGKPVANAKIYMMNRHGKLTPAGIPGELCIGGPGVGRGYLGREELTREKFTANPFEPGKKIYRTGDLARWLPDGNIEFMGRIDQQVKIRGFRIELGEIESAVKKIPEIKDCVVIDRDDSGGNKYLCGYYTADKAQDTNVMRKELAAFLPDYMIPACFLKIEQIPLTPNGKVDKKALPAPDHSEFSSGEAYVAPANDTEKTLSRIWSEVLRCGQVGVQNNFFGLGGDSIMGIQVAARARKAGLDISVGDLQTHPTISELLKNLDEKKKTQKDQITVQAGAAVSEPQKKSEGIAAGRPEIEAAFDISPLQEGFLFYAVSSPDSDQYSIQTCWTYNSKINTDALKQAWEEIYVAHPALRTAFEWKGTARPYQAVYKNTAAPWNLIDFRNIAAHEREKLFDEQRENIRKKPFELDKPPISRLHLFIFGESEYRFVWTIHHILIDGWSIPLVINELNARYACIAGKKEFSAPASPSFETYIKWLSAKDKKETMEYWKGNLHDFTTPTPLVINKRSGELSVHKAVENQGMYVRNIPAAFLEKCRAFARTQHVTLNALFQTAWASVLSAYSGSEDVLYGVTVSDRPPEISGVENMVGLFINTVPMRARLDHSKTASANIKKMHNAVQDSSRHCHIPLNKLQALAAVTQGEALFYSIFVFENFPFDESADDNKNLAMSGISSYGKSNYPLNVVVMPGPDAALNFSYDADIFEAAAIESLAAHIERALEWIVNNPNGFLKDIDILPEKEKEKLLLKFNRTDVEIRRNVTVHELIEESAERFPDKTAVVYKDDRLSYRELNERANRLAHKLRGLGVKPDDRIGVLVDRSYDMITGPLAVLKAGAAFVPIDPQYPADRINYILSDSSCPLLLTQPHLAEKIKPSVMTIDMTDPANYSGDGKNPALINNDQNLAYLIYTSGSTGLPKGSMIEHHSLVNICLYYQKNHQITELDNFAKYVSFGFDASIVEIFPALVSGSALFVIPEELRLSPAGLNEYFEANNITMVIFPTPFGEQFMTLTDNKSLRWMELGGDKLKVFKKHKYTVVNGYGPTECTVCATDFAVENLVENIPIGKPVYNTKIYIMDRYGKLTPAGIPGELCIAGAGVGRGYLGREELTREKFTANPFEPGKKMYKTGDLARWLPDGNIEFMGRIDQQVKIRGFRIELGEIESAVKKIHGIKDCVVIDRDDSGGNKYLCGYYTAGEALDTNVMRKELAAFLPDYMIPSCFLKIDEIPFTTHGKVDKKALPVPKQSALTSEEAYVPPGNAMEEILARIWQEVLKCGRVGIHDNFFSLGGDSIMSIQVVARACAEGLNITAAQILKNPTIAALATKIQVKPSQRVDMGPLSGDLPLTPIQKWFFENQFTNFNHFNQPFLFKLKTRCRKETIEKILNVIVDHHDCLRLRLKNEGGEWSQRYKKAGEDPVVVETIDLRDLSAEKASAAITETCSKIQGSLNISEGPIIKAALFTGHADGQERLFIAVHHIGIDMVSWRIIIEDFHALYDKITAGEEPVLTVKTSSYRQWAEVLGKFEVSAAAKKHWAQTLEEAPKTPAEYKRSSFGKMKDHKVSLDAAQTELLINSVPAAYGTKINDILLSALLVAFNRAAGAASLLVNLEGHGREEIPEDMNISRTVGWFTSVFPVHLKSSALSDMGATIKSVKEILRSVPDSGLSYGVLRYLSADAEKFRSLEKKTVGFNYLGRIDSSVLDGKLLCGAPESTGAFMAPENGVINLLDINCFVAGGELVMDFGYSTDIWGRETIAAIAENYMGALKEMIAACLAPSAKSLTPSDFPLAAVTQAFLDGIEDQQRIESIYGLSPLQEGMLFHAMYSPQSDEYTMQINWRYKERIDVDALERSWKEVISRHAILRTAFVYKDLDAPVQIVYKSVETPWRFEDWSGFDESVKKQKLEQKFLNERLQGFELSTPCLMKFTLVKLAEADFAFAWTSHHIIQDGWSLPIIMTETDACYRAFTDNKKPDLAPAVSYEEYIKWLSGSKKDEARKFWKEYLKGFSTPTPIPIALSGAKPSARGHMSNLKELKIDYSKEFARDCESFAKANKITVNSLLQTAWAAVLSNYSGQKEVLFGATVSGRPAELRGVENIVGLFINAIPVRVVLDDNAGALTQMTNFHRSFQESSNHFTLSLSEIQSFASVPASESFFNSLFIFQNYPYKDAAAKHEKLNKVEIDGFERTNYPVTLIFTMQEIMSLKLLYDGASFEDGIIKNIGGHLYEAARWLMQNPGRPIKEARIISEAEEKQIVHGFNDTAFKYDENKLVGEYIEEAVEKFGDKTAVVFGEKSISYRELNEKANSLAHILIKNGICRGKAAGVLMDRSIEMVIAVIAVIKSGGAYIPIDHEYPASRIAYMMRDAGAQILLTKPELIENLDFKGTVVRLDDESVYAGEKKNPRPLNMPSDTATIIYTSGSTGNPKGVITLHGALSHFCLWYKETRNICEKDNMTKYVSFGFDVTMWEIFPALMSGATLHVISGDIRLSPYQLNEYFEKNNITLSFLPTQFCEQFMASVDNSSLRWLDTAGEKLRTYTKRNYTIANCYGPTEYTDCISWLAVDRQYVNIPIGKPIWNTRVYILGEGGKLVPACVPGELCVAGSGMTGGYLNRPDLTESKYIDNPIAPGEKIYRTGDMARWLPDGNLEYIGRIDTQVKIRGFRIELSEVEQVIKNIGWVSDAAVIDREDGSGRKYLCAYYVAGPEIAIAESEQAEKIRSFLKGTLPDYMTPQFIIKIGVIPLTPNGKIDRKSLPAPDASLIKKEEFIAPKTETEKKMAGIWEDVLGLKTVGILNNFFDLGGHSLKAALLQSKMQKEFGVTIALKDIFDHPNISELAGIVEKSSARVSHIGLVPEMQYYPASSAQKRILLLSRMENDGMTYNIPSMFVLEGSLDPKKFGDAIDAMVERHEILRTSFHITEDGLPVQKVNEKIDIKHIYRQADEKEIDAMLRDFIRPFNLEKPPLIRYELIKMAPKKHALLMDVHHIIFDGISYDIFLKELWSLYEGKDLEPLKIQFKDFAFWQDSLLESGQIEKQKKYWLDAYRGDIPQLNLTTDLPRSSEMSFHGKHRVYSIDGALAENLRSWSGRKGSTLFVTLFSAFSVLLSRYSSQKDIIIATPGSGRNIPEVEPLIGMFVNTLPIRTAPDPETSFDDFVRETGRRVLAAYDNQDYQLDTLLDDLSVKREAGHNPLFDVLFTLINKKDGNYSKDIAVKPMMADLDVAKLDIALSVIELADKIDFTIEYRDDLFRPETIDGIGRHFINLLGDIVRKEGAKLKELQAVSEEEKRKLLYEFNDTARPYDIQKTIHEMIEASASLHADKPAVVCKGRKLTYGQLNTHAAVLCEKLLSRGINGNGIIAIMVSQCLEMIPGILAVLKSGSAFLPIDPSYPPERIEYMLKDAEVKILLTEKHLAQKVNFSGSVICLDEQGLFDGAPVKLEKRGKPSDLAYIIYTSGTTGKPKGVMIEHSSLVNMSLCYRDAFAIAADDVGSKYAGFSFDAGIGEIFPCLIAGASLHIIPEEIRLSPDDINEYFEKNKITYAFLPTQFAEQFMILKKNSSLKNLLIGGDKLRVFEKQSYNVINGYGPTEYTMVTSIFKIDRMYDNIPIGRPIANSEVYILDGDKSLQPAGVPGELHVSGPGLARGYLKRPELTAEKFVNNPFRAERKMYRTGDLARWLPDGNIEFMGRIDEQVKIRGYRIELGEIENALKDSPLVKEAVVIAREKSCGDKYLCAYYVPVSSHGHPGTDEIDKIKAFLKQSLPDYMVPQFIIKIASMPLTPNGKVDKRSLPVPDVSGAGEEFVPPKTDTEIKMAGLWEEVLSVKKVGITNNFFELGGHSLKAVVLQSRIQKDFSVTIPLKDIFKYPTVKELSTVLEKSSRKVSSIPPAPPMEHYPASSAQKRLLLIDQMEGNNITYNTPLMLSIEGPLDAKKLSGAIDKLVERHEILRTSFHVKDGRPVQKIHEKVFVKRIYRQEKEENIPEIMKNFVRPFSLSRPPLIRFELIKTGPDKHLFMMDSHHIIFDGMSYEIFLGELWSEYEGKSLEPVKVQFKDYAFWHENLLKSEEIDRQKKYWMDMFDGELPQLNLTTDFTRPSEMSFHGKMGVYKIDADLAARLKSLANQNGTTLFMTLFAAYSLLLSKYASQEDIIIGTTGSGRTVPDMDSIIGMFVNTLAIRTSPKRDKTFEDFLKETEQRILSAYDNQDYQLDMLIDELSIKRDLSRNTLFDVFFTLTNKKDASPSNDITIKGVPLSLGVAKFDLLLAAAETGQGIDLNFEYRDSLFKPETIDAMAEHFIELLGDITGKKEAKLKDIQIVSESQKRKLLDEFSGASVSYDLNKTIHEMIEECAELYPDNTAVVCKGRKLNYGRLNADAAVLCEKLLSRGINGNGIIAIMVSQCLEMIPGILAILKSGSAFLPIDPSYPPERIEYMLKDAEVKILMTEKHLAQKVNFEGATICLDDQGIFEGTPAKFENRGKPSDLAYIIYTSGTTGKPKGVMIEHSSLINLSLFYRDLFSITSDDAGSKYAGFSFDAGIGEIFPALISGAALHIISEEMRLSPDDINEYFEMNKITFAFLPTQFAEQFMELEENNSLKNLLTGGDKLRVFKKRPYNVINAYGPTEYTMITSTFKIDRMYDNIPIGRPVANSDIYILDADGCLLPAGVPGELYVAGPGLARGYLKRPELTAEKFMNNPFRAGQKMYRTGDLARWLPDGNIEFMGRIDEQVKIRGYRIELGEIEHALKNCEGIKDAVVIARDLGGGDKTLCAYIVSGPEVIIDDLKSVLKKSLPEYMVPSYFMVLDNIPLTPNGKTDRKKLPEPDIKKEKKDGRAAESETEIKVYEAWKKVLGISDIGMSDNFFALGGHSIKAVALTAELQKDFEIKLNDIFKYQTISELSVNIKRIKDNLKRKLLDIKKQITSQDPKSDPFAGIVNDISAYRNNYKKYASVGASPKKDYRNILLTGATGFLGSYLLRDLLTETGASVFVPVRGGSVEDCSQRLAQKLGYYFGPKFFDEYKDRITVLKSDLADENLSLDKEQYGSLSQKIDCIINSAANVKHYGLYQEFYVSNVKSVDNLIAFALAGRQKDLHHVSTISVGMGHIENKDAALFTEETVDSGQDSGNYYLQTKLDGEKLIVKARKKGLIANIYRVGNITFDSREGKFQENIGSNGFYQRVRAFINLGIVPEGFGGVDFSYVDGISRAILSIYNLAGLENEIFHIENPEKADIGKILTAEELGLNIQVMDIPALIDRLLEHYDHGGFREYIENLMVHMGWMAETDSRKPTAIMTLSEKTDLVLKSAGFRWPALSFDAARGMIYEALKERAAVIKGCSIFKDLSGNELCEISARAGQFYYQEDIPILQEGAPNDSLYVIAEGAVSISCTSRDGWIGTVSIMGKGDFVGEQNVFGPDASNILAESAAGGVLVFAFKTVDIRKFIDKYPKIAGSFITELNERIETLRKLIVLMG